jgi:hypothetical protein
VKKTMVAHWAPIMCVSVCLCLVCILVHMVVSVNVYVHGSVCM